MLSFFDPRHLSGFPPLLVRQRKSWKHSVLIDPGEDVGCFSCSTLRHLPPKLLRPRKAATTSDTATKAAEERAPDRPYAFAITTGLFIFRSRRGTSVSSPPIPSVGKCARLVSAT